MHFQINFDVNTADDTSKGAVLFSRLAAAFSGSPVALSGQPAARGRGRPPNPPAAPDAAPATVDAVDTSPATTDDILDVGSTDAKSDDLLDAGTGSTDDDLLADMATGGATPTREEMLTAVKTAATAKGVDWIRENAIQKFKVKAWSDLKDSDLAALHKELCSVKSSEIPLA